MTTGHCYKSITHYPLAVIEEKIQETFEKVCSSIRRVFSPSLSGELSWEGWVPSRRLTSLCEVVIPGTIASRVYNHWRKNKHGPGSSDLFRRIEVGRNILITQTLQAWVKRGVAERHGERPGEYRLVRQLCLCADPYS